MPDETQSLEDFQHLHRDGLKNLEIERGRLAEARQRFDLGELDEDLLRKMTDARETLSAKLERGPETVFQFAVQLLGDVDAKRFIIENALESLKNGKKPSEILTTFSSLGLITKAPSPKPTFDPLATTRALLERKSIVGRVMTALAQIGVNALKTVPKWVEIEPHFTVFPVPSLGFALKGKGMSVHELFEALRGTESPALQ